MGRFSKKINYSLRIENCFKFLTYTYSDVKDNWYKDIELSNIKSIEEVYTILLCKVTKLISRRGLYKEYIKIENKELSSPKGRIEIEDSLVRQTNIKGKLICSYDELSDNVLHNQIIKTVLLHMVYCKQLSKDTITMIQKTINELNGIDIIKLESINWKKIKYNNSNIRYKTALNICKTLVNMEKATKITEYTFEDKLYIAFVNHLYLWYNRHYSDKMLVERLTHSKYESKYRFEKIVNSNRNYIAIRTENKHNVIMGFEKFSYKLSSDEQEKQFLNLKELCEEYERLHNNIKTSGCIIYVNSSDGYTDTDIQVVNVDGKIICHTSIDCNINYKYIEYKLDKILTVALK